MASGYQTSSGNDLDSVFDPYVQGSKPAATGYQTSDGRDLNQRYAPRSFGSAAASTGIKLASGADLNTLWAARGSAVYWDGSLDDLPDWESDDGASSSIALVDILFLSNGEIRLHQNYPFANKLLGHWHGQIANASNTEIRFVVVAGALDQNTASSFRALTTRQNFLVTAGPSGRFEQSTARVRVELQLTGNSGTRITREISVSAAHSGGGDIFPLDP